MDLIRTISTLLIAGYVAVGAALILGGCTAHHPVVRAGSSGLVRPAPVDRASNLACLDCHADLANELIASAHLKKGYACTACHGPSVAHGEDEANVIKPDVLFGRTEITPFCKLCHPEHKKSDAYDDFIQQWRGQRRPTGVMILNDATCTDCHGRHLMIGAG